MKGAKFSAHAELVHSVAAQLPNDGTRMQLLASTVDSSWRRCLNDFNLDPARDYEPEVLDHSRLKQRQAELEDLVQIARVEMDSLYEQISGSGFALLLADTEGVILLERVDPTLKRHFAEAGLVVGANWSERCEGTNGIGTCVTEKRSVTIFRDDHFRDCHAGLSCSAAPIHDPYGHIIAVLDASTVSTSGGREAQLHTVALVNLSARLIEKCLFLRHHQSDAMLRFHHRPEFVDLLHDGAIAVSPDGCIVGTDITGIKLLGAGGRRELVGRSIAEVFDTSYGELRAMTNSGLRTMQELRDIRFGRRYFASLAEAGQQNSRPALSAHGGARIVRIATERSNGPLSLEELAGDDPQMLRNLRNAQRVAECAVSVVICGPTGSGKEAFAKAMHLASSRSKQTFVAVNCAAIPETLIEAELFGYASGAFTGARREGMRGRILQSSGGTLFLDEIGDMPLLMQTRLLRVLEEQEVTPLGSEVTHKVDLRVICASHRELRELVQRGQFREDLYYRLNGITLDLPPLAARRDKESLIKKCLAREFKDAPMVSIEARAMERLIQYAWPGNIRELRNAIRAALAICEDRIIRMGDLPIAIQQFRPVGVTATLLPLAPPMSMEGAAISLESAEREALLRCIEQHRGNMTVVAAHLGISRNTLYRKIHRHGIQISRRADQTQA
ncbi:MAG TPA: sigma-54-dependent Fis family transcriptional regulator [Steroidobacteraceae bacterium]|jgi:transcriptional regulator of acetoin/glycerol metabolism